MHHKNIAKKVLFWGLFGVILVLGVIAIFSMRQGGAGTIRASFVQEKQEMGPVVPASLTEEIILENAVSNEETTKEVSVENIASSPLNETETDEPKKETSVEEKAVVASEPALVPANKSAEKPAVVKTDKRIKCKMKAKEIKKDKKDKKDKDKDVKVEISWECTNPEGWSCSIKRDEYSTDKEKKQNAVLPKGSTTMVIKEGHMNSTATHSYSCGGVSSSYYSSGCYSTYSSTSSYSPAPNEYKMECRSVDGKIERFEKVEWK